jgi:geranylgeranyl diphosphate synthase type I
MSDQFLNTLLIAIETELQRQVSKLDASRTEQYHAMLTYHMGWTGDGAGLDARGKRIRPLLVLLTAASNNTNWQLALPAAASVELVHNFSLVHDDIQDNSDKRRGRPTIWAKWGVPQAINAGDGLFALSNLAITDLSANYQAETVMSVSKILQNTCLDLTRGQYLDMSYEKRADLGMEDYWPMISGKTAALLSACCAIGALLGNANDAVVEAYRTFGHYLGLAFQLQDDILGIWGNESLTGKSAASDLLEGKKSLPVLVGLSKKGKFATKWNKGPLQPDEIDEMAKVLASEGGYSYAQDAAIQMTDLALISLRTADPQGEAGDTLMELTNKLLSRNA